MMIRKIRQSDKLFVPADKTNNFYEITKQNHDKIMIETITKVYKKADKTLPNVINNEAKKLATTHNVSDRTDTMAKQEAFTAVKDHKENFRENPKCRLITKSELGKLSKPLLQRVNNDLREKLM